MAEILAFAGSNSSTSINFKLVEHTVSLVQDHDIQTLNMAEYDFPIYSEDHEAEQGFSGSLVELKQKLENSDAMVLSVNEHNGNPSAYFKNILDWLSRMDRNFLLNTKVMLMSASPGRFGGVRSLVVVEGMIPKFGGEVVSTFSLKSFNENFGEAGILDEDMKSQHQKALDIFLNSLK
ncbi:MAG: NAD(P)H-dependent oxidoreductase [Bacteroidota bacterium]|uniref:NAD(P)H-dependent oxidoreductase n=1 Tax=Flagellimonas profundi TaxID=2915620 RepID=A0ABS3FD95_9FLAO|nr:NAD(P)H-dependent oxidoreductase [Allomuricauda profundi]MBO0341130.1 NAD(P)H-dependent oxidoreductase [Allomuricauda profundi]MEC7771010.1 NAD(P)H-dependent oxidoreductase [Bacteroidota bacterium]